MRVTLTTDGGFTGRGIGSVVIEEADERLASLIATAKPWLEEYGAKGRDLVRYTLTVDGRSVSWVDGAEIPDDLREVFEAVTSGTLRS